MKVYKIRTGVAIEDGKSYYSYDLPGSGWDDFINDDNLLRKLDDLIGSGKARKVDSLNESEILPPIGSQELWACGVTYLRSKVGRQEESKTAGGADFYAKVYEAERPEVFFKSTPHRIAGHNSFVRIRKDSTWDVPEPELTLVVTSSGKIIGYTIGNDMSSRSIEGENPLYLPQAKTYDGCASLGPCIYVTNKPLDTATTISLIVIRGGRKVFESSIAINQIKRSFEELVSFVFRECSFPHGCLIMTGTGIVPGHEFSLKSNDEIRISIEGIGELVNTVQ